MIPPNLDRTQPASSATVIDKRVVTMPDGRYMIFYTYPQIDRDSRQRREASANDRSTNLKK